MSNPMIANLKQGICAYNYGNYTEALAHFQTVLENSPETMMQDQAKKNLIKTYRKLGKMEEAIDLCYNFLGHSVYHLWAVKTLAKLGIDVEGNSLEESDGELSAPLLPPELESAPQNKSLYVQLIDRIKQLFHKDYWSKIFSFLN
ncbi:MAG: tol-pal system YbgF family protein [Microcystaceae cyanobacterium]